MVNVTKTTVTGNDLLKSRTKNINSKNGSQPPISLESNLEASVENTGFSIPLYAQTMPQPPQAELGTNPQFGNNIEDARLKAKPQLKIAILGTAPSSRNLAPWQDTSWKIWACSPGNIDIPRWDVWFEIHSNLLWPENQHYGVNYVEWLKKNTPGKLLYMQNQELVPNATPLPINELIQEFGRYFFTSSFAYMIAMAIKAGATDIALFGIDMASKNEYILQRPGGHYFMQLAATRGIRVSIPYESDLAQHPPLYGYSDSTPFGRKVAVREQELNNRVAQMKSERDKLNTNITYLEGAVEDLDYIKSIWGGVQ